MEILTLEAIEFYEAIVRVAEAIQSTVHVKLPEMRDFLAAARASLLAEDRMADLQRALAAEEASLRKALNEPGGVTRSDIDAAFGRLRLALEPLAASGSPPRHAPGVCSMARH